MCIIKCIMLHGDFYLEKSVRELRRYQCSDREGGKGIGVAYEHFHCSLSPRFWPQILPQTVVIFEHRQGYFIRFEQFSRRKGVEFVQIHAKKFKFCTLPVPSSPFKHWYLHHCCQYAMVVNFWSKTYPHSCDHFPVQAPPSFYKGNYYIALGILNWPNFLSTYIGVSSISIWPLSHHEHSQGCH